MKYKTLCGKEFEKNYDLYASSFNCIDCKECRECSAPKVENKSKCIAYNANYKNWPTVSNYLELGSNTEETYIFEVVLALNEYQTILYQSYVCTGTIPYTLMANIAQDIYEDYIERGYSLENGKIEVPMFDKAKGVNSRVLIENADDLKSLIISIRLIRFSQNENMLQKVN